MLHSSQKACKRARKIGQRIGAHEGTKSLVDVQMSVGVDQHAAYLGLESPQCMQGQRDAVEWFKSLVDATHTGALAACQHQAGDVL